MAVPNGDSHYSPLMSAPTVAEFAACRGSVSSLVSRSHQANGRE